MDSYLKIVKKHILKDVKSYTIVIFSLVSAITLLSIILGIYKAEIYRLNNDITSEYGVYDAYFNGMTYEEINVLERHNNVEDIAKINILGETEPLGLSESKFKIQLLEGDKNIFYKFNEFNLIDGRLPERVGECIVSYKIMEILGKDVYIGDQIKIPYIDIFGSPKEIPLRVVGIIEGVTPMMREAIIRGDSEGIGECLLIYKEELNDLNGIYRGYVQASGKVTDIYADFKIKEGMSPVELNQRYSRKALKYDAGFTGSIIELNTPFAVITFSVVILLVCINSISMIYKLKEKDLKHLSIIGANERQIKLILLIEILLLWFISSLLSFILIGIVFMDILNIVIISAVLILLINFAAFMIMFKYKNKNNEIQHYYKKDRIEKRLAYSYYKNNMERNRFSILSIGISFLLIVMFLNQLLMGASNMNSKMSIDAEILYEKVATVFSESEIRKLETQSGVKEVYEIDEIPWVIGIPITKTVEKDVVGYVEGESIEEEDSELLYNATIKIVEDEMYDMYLKDNKPSNENGVIINLNTIVNSNVYSESNMSESQKIKQQDYIHLMYASNDNKYNFRNNGLAQTYESNKNEYSVKKVVIEETISTDIFGIETNLEDSIQLIMRESTAKEILGFQNYKKVYIKLEDKSDEIKMNEIQENIENKGDKYVNLTEYEKDRFKELKNDVGIYMVMSLLLVILSLTNTIITLIFNIVTRRTDRQLLGAIGMSQTQLKIMVRYENYYVIRKAIYAGLVLSAGISMMTQLQFVRGNFKLILVWIFVMIITAIFIVALTLVITQLCVYKILDLDSENSNINKM